MTDVITRAQATALLDLYHRRDRLREALDLADQKLIGKTLFGDRRPTGGTIGTLMDALGGQDDFVDSMTLAYRDLVEDRVARIEAEIKSKGGSVV